MEIYILIFTIESADDNRSRCVVVSIWNWQIDNTANKIHGIWGLVVIPLEIDDTKKNYNKICLGIKKFNSMIEVWAGLMVCTMDCSEN